MSSRHRESVIRRKFNRYRSALIKILLIVLILMAAVFGAVKLEKWLYKKTEVPAESTVSVSSDRINVNGRWYVEKNNVRTTLLLGVDKFGAIGSESYNDSSRQSDFMLVLVEDPDSGSYSMLHLNRDTLTRIPKLAVNGRVAAYYNGQLTLAYAEGNGQEDSCKNAVRAVSKLLLDHTIDHYFAFTMDAVPVLNDAVGGVPVVIEEDLSDVDPLMKAGETVVLQGDQALTFIRSRDESMDSNVLRMKRQKAYMLSWLNKVRNMAEDEDYTALLTKVEPYIITDLNTAQIDAMIKQADLYLQGEYIRPAGELKMGEKYVEYHIDEQDLEDIVLRLFYREV